MVKNPPSNAGDAGLISGQGTKIPHAVGQLKPVCLNYCAHVPSSSCSTTSTLRACHNEDPAQPKLKLKKVSDWGQHHCGEGVYKDEAGDWEPEVGIDGRMTGRWTRKKDSPVSSVRAIRGPAYFCSSQPRRALSEHASYWMNEWVFDRWLHKRKGGGLCRGVWWPRETGNRGRGPKRDDQSIESWETDGGIVKWNSFCRKLYGRSSKN